MNNKQLTKKIFTQNIEGSFLFILDRVPDKQKPQDRITDMRVSVYHFLIVKEKSRYSFPDIMDSFDYEPFETYFHDLEELDMFNNDDAEFWICDTDFSKDSDINKERKNSVSIITSILKDENVALLYLKDPLYSKIAKYKSLFLKGNPFPIYHSCCEGNVLANYKCIYDEDILTDLKLEEQFYPWFHKLL